jgi:hypothetical protein
MVPEDERDENKYQRCARMFENDCDERQEAWVGFETCCRWFHHDFSGLSNLPEEQDPWTYHIRS